MMFAKIIVVISQKAQQRQELADENMSGRDKTTRDLLSFGSFVFKHIDYVKHGIGKCSRLWLVAYTCLFAS